MMYQFMFCPNNVTLSNVEEWFWVKNIPMISEIILSAIMLAENGQ
ncbi:MAG: hypothetical protein ABJP77_05015 [Lentilitoribacter sp.]